MENQTQENKIEAAAVHIRQVSQEDMEAVWQIRNNPKNRVNFAGQGEIDLESHKKWFKKKYFDNPENRCFILEADNKVVGYCRFDLEDGKYRISIALEPDFQGKNLGKKFLGDSIRQMNLGKDLVAEVKKDNVPSAKVFEANGFKVVGEDENFYFFNYESKKE